MYVHESQIHHPPFSHDDIQNTIIEVDATSTCDDKETLRIGERGWLVDP
jgi:hypothetical protein